MYKHFISLSENNEMDIVRNNENAVINRLFQKNFMRWFY